MFLRVQTCEKNGGFENSFPFFRFWVVGKVGGRDTSNFLEYCTKRGEEGVRKTECEMNIAAAYHKIRQLLKIVKILIPSFFIFQTGHTALQRAATEGHLEIIRALVRNGVAVDHQDEAVRQTVSQLKILVSFKRCKLLEESHSREWRKKILFG